MTLVKEQTKAISLRKKGYTYREILKQIPVAKSTLSLWLRDVGLSKRQIHRITEKKLAAGRRGAAAQKLKRKLITQGLKESAAREIDNLSFDRSHLWLMGTMLYWAEGAKEKANSQATGVKFGNTDPLMLKLMKRWLLDVCNVPANQIRYNLYLHENNKFRLDAVRRYWLKRLKIDCLHAVYFKKHAVKTVRKNIGKNYFGLMMMVVKKSTSLNRRIAGWTEAIGQKVEMLPGRLTASQ
ncbi:MAG: hypothetical protein JW873_05330 [Candidatus Saganbacteria bacterium]|nr:hypothetical protein [Candidatus Saganbacteria bacterium]